MTGMKEMVHIEGLDEFDNKIIELLKDNARLSYSEIGEQIGISPGWYAVRELFEKIMKA